MDWQDFLIVLGVIFIAVLIVGAVVGVFVLAERATDAYHTSVNNDLRLDDLERGVYSGQCPTRSPRPGGVGGANGDTLCVDGAGQRVHCGDVRGGGRLRDGRHCASRSGPGDGIPAHPSRPEHSCSGKGEGCGR